MSDAGKSVRSPSKTIKTRSVRSDAKTPTITTPSVSNPSSNRQSKYLASGESESRKEQEQERPVETALPRSHTPGHLASKSSSGRDRKSADLATRRRSKSTSQVSAATSASSSIHNPTLPPITDDKEDSAGNEEKGKRPLPISRTTSSLATRKTVSSSTTSRQTSKTSTTPRGQYIPFPPLPDVKDFPDVEPAPPSGMYWSKAFVSGHPHANFRAHSTTLVGSNIYVFGGCDAGACHNSVYVLDADAFYWSVPHQVGDLPIPLRAMTCTAVGKKLVIFGGGDGPAYYNDVYILDTLNFRWTKPRIVGERIPSKRRAHTACLYKNGIYVFGGGDGVRALNDIWRLDVSDVNKMSWKLISGPEKSTPGGKETRPKARGYHTANMVGSKLIIFGGSDGGECFDDVWVYDVETHVWKRVNVPVTYRRLSHSATLVGSYLFVIGGHNGSDYCNDVLLLNLVTMTWDKRKVYGKPPCGRGYHGAVLHDSRLLVIGGFDGVEVFGDVTILELGVHAYYSQISHFTIEV